MTVAAFPLRADQTLVLETRSLSVCYGDVVAVDGVSLAIADRAVTSIIGPSGCGKSTLLRALNRMNETVTGVETRGRVLYRSQDLYAEKVDPVEVRRRIGMVFQKPNPFPKTIFRNVAWGPSISGVADDSLPELVEASLRRAALWGEVKDRLHESALELSGGQQQRLCLARALAMEPEVILMDEPCSALDPVSTGKIEDLLFELKNKLAIVVVTHNMQQAGRISDYTAFMDAGQLIEMGETDQVFMRPRERRTEQYVTGRFG